MQTYNISIKKEQLFLAATYMTLLLSLINLHFFAYVIFFFCVGLKADKIKDGLRSIIKLSPNTLSLSSLLVLITFAAVTVSCAVNRYFPTERLGIVLLTLNKTKIMATEREIVRFCLSVVICFVFAVAVLMIANSVKASFDCFFICLCVFSLWNDAKIIPTEYICRYRI